MKNVLIKLLVLSMQEQLFDYSKKYKKKTEKLQKRECTKIKKIIFISKIYLVCISNVEKNKNKNCTKAFFTKKMYKTSRQPRQWKSANK